jgi:hypothetical protein
VLRRILTLSESQRRLVEMIHVLAVLERNISSAAVEKALNKK